MSVTGRGGTATGGGSNFGVWVDGAGTMITSGGGSVTIDGTGGGTGTGSDRNFGVVVGGLITAGGSGAVSVTGRGGTAAGGGDNSGVWVTGTGAAITSGGGSVSVDGTGGGSGTSSNDNYGVVVVVGGLITAGGSGAVSVTGQGGTAAGGNSNSGVRVETTGVAITSGGGSVTVDGTGGGSGTSSDNNHGVYLLVGGQITAGGSGAVSVTGQGCTAAGGSGNHGVWVANAGAAITSGGGNVTVDGTGGGSGTSGGDNQGVYVNYGGQITAGGSGAVNVTGQGGTAAGAFNHGVWIAGTGAAITSGGGNVTVDGTGGGSGTSAMNSGVGVAYGGQITAGGSGAVSVTGRGGTAAGGSDNIGVSVTGTGATITSGGGNVTVDGTGGGSGTSSSFNHGVYVLSDGQITAGGNGAVGVTGRGSTTAEGDANYGVWVYGTGAAITSGGGNVTVTAVAGGGSFSEAARVDNSGRIASTGNAAVTLTADSVEITTGGTLSAGTGTATLQTWTAGTRIDLGGVDVLTGSPLTLGLTVNELNQVTAGTLVVGRDSAGIIRVMAPITRTGVLSLVSAAAVDDRNVTGTDLTVPDLRITAGTGIGDADPLDIDTAQLTFTNSTAGGVQFAEAGTTTVNTSANPTRGVTFAGGRFDIGAGQTLTAGLLTVATGGTLGGTGTVSGAVGNAGTTAPGFSPGVLTTGSYTFAGGGTCVVEIGGPAPGNTATDHDQLNVTGGVTIESTAALGPSLFGGFTPVLGHSYVIVNNDGTDAVVGTFAGLDEGATLTLGGLPFLITYMGGDGNDIALETNRPSSPVLAVMVGDLLRLTDLGTGAVRELVPFPWFRGTATVAVSDLTGDGVPDVVVGAGPGGGPHVRVFDGVNLSELASFFAYDEAFRGGVNVAAAAGRVVTGAGAGGGPHVKVFDATGASVYASFFAYDEAFRGGVNVAVGDLTGDRVPDIVTGAGPGGGPHVKVFDGVSLSELTSFFAYDEAFRGGVNVAVGDLTGDRVPDIVTGAGAGGGPHVRVFDRTGAVEYASFFAYDEAFRGGVRVAIRDVSDDGVIDLITGAGPGGGPHVKAFTLPGLLTTVSYFAGDPAYTGGVFVG